MALKIKHICLRNWMKISDADVAFPDYGLVMVLGHNAASGGALESVGSGKTSFGEALSRTLLGHSGRFTHAKNCSTDRKGDTYVALECDLDGEPLLVESGYKCKELSKSGEALRYTWREQVIERGHINETRQQLNQLLGINDMLVPWTVFIDGDDLRFNKMSQANSVDMVLAALRQPPWNDYYDSAKSLLGEFRRDITKLEAQAESHQIRLTSAKEDVLDAKNALQKAQETYDTAKAAQQDRIAAKQARLEERDKSIGHAKDRRKKIVEEIKQIEATKAEGHHKLEIELREGEENLRKFRERRKTLMAHWQEAQEAATEAQSHYTAYRDSVDTCPTCQRPMGDEKIDPIRLQKLKEDAHTAKADAAKRRELISASDQDIEDWEETLEEIQAQIKELSVETQIRALSNEDHRLEQSIQEDQDSCAAIQEQIQRLKAELSDAEIKSCQATLEERRRVVAKTKEALAQSKAELEESLSQAKVLDYWAKAFSPVGIPNLVLREAIAPLNQEAKRISALMTGGTINVTYSTRRELATGQQKAELVVNVDNKLGCDDIAGSSKGESRLTNLVIAETLSEVGQVTRQAGYRWYDEILTNLDKTSRTNILKYLKEVASKMKVLIFVVDHHTETASFADYVLKIEKLEDSAKVSWA